MAPTLDIKRLLTLACVLALAAPSLARADHGEPYTHPALAQYLEIAEAHWGSPPPSCGAADGQVIPVHVVLYDNPNPKVTATAEQPGCRIWLDRDWWPAPASRIDCTIIAHEWGHLLGHGHSHDKSSLMFPQPLTGAPGCWAFTPRLALGSAVVQSSGPAGRRKRRGHRARRAATARRTHRHRQLRP
jgi:Matrixin